MHSELIPLWGWILFYAMVLLMLAIDLKSFGRKGQHEVSISEALHMTVVWIVVSLLFCAGIYFFYPIDPHQKALEFLSGYLIEKSLSVDNLFVFLMLFTFFGVERKYQHEVLFWGIIGALVLRSIFIFLGAAVVTRFEWVLAIFGVFLLYSGAKMFTHDEEAQPDPSRNIFVRLFRRFFPVTDRMHGGKFFMFLISSVQNIVADLVKHSSPERILIGDFSVKVVLVVHSISIPRIPTRKLPHSLFCYTQCFRILHNCIHLMQ